MIRKALLIVAAATLISSSIRADETGNLTSLARVWAAVKFLDPARAAGVIDWDAALVRAIPRVRAAKNDDELAGAIGTMLAELHDTSSRVIRKRTPEKNDVADVPLTRTDGDVLILNAGAFVSKNGWAVATSRFRAFDLTATKLLLIDLRTNGSENGASSEMYALGFLPLSAEPLYGPARRFAFHSGYAERGSSSGGYYSGLLEVDGAALQTSHGGAPQRIAFVTDATTGLPDVAVALRSAGRAFVAASAPAGDEMIGLTEPIDLPGGWRAEIRIAELHGTEVSVDVVDADPVAASLAVLRGERVVERRETPPAEAARPAHWRIDDDFATMTYPDVEHRLLAAFRLWAVIHYFYPYRDLIGDWDAVLVELLPRFIAAANADDYAQAVVEMDTHVEDGHSTVSGHKSIAKIFGGAARIPAEVRVVENEFVVTKSDVPELKPGDIIDSIDGEPFRERVDRAYKLVTASREVPRINRAASNALRGAPETPAVVGVRGADGARIVNVTRTMPKPPAPSPDPSYRMMAGNVGYVDMTRIETSEVDAMFEALGQTKAVIFDMRGYPRGTAWLIAPRINTRHAKIGAIFRRPEVSGISETGGHFFEQALPLTDKPLYTGRTVMLIDDRAISQSEHTALFFEQASGTTFIGTPTAGANGDVSSLTLPGGIAVTFTGHDVRHADGRQLQRIGIQPDIEVAPTINGIRAGRDEVLDRAIEYVNATIR